VHRVEPGHSILGSICLKRCKERFFQFRFQLSPDIDDSVISFTVGHAAFLVSIRYFFDLVLSVGNKFAFILGYHHIVNADGNTRLCRVFEAQILKIVQKLSRAKIAVLIVACGNKVSKIARFQFPVAKLEVLWQYLIKYNTSGSGLYRLTVDPEYDRSMNAYHIRVQRDHNVIRIGEQSPVLCSIVPFLCQVIASQNNIQVRYSYRLAMGWFKDIPRSHHKESRLDLGFGRQRDMNCHLIAVKIRVERLANQRMNPDGFAFHQNRLKRLNTESMQCGRAVKNYRMFGNYLIKHLPHFVGSSLRHLFGALDRGSVSLFLKPPNNKWLEKLKSHFSRQTALIHSQFRSYDYN